MPSRRRLLDTESLPGQSLAFLAIMLPLEIDKLFRRINGAKPLPVVGIERPDGVPLARETQVIGDTDLDADGLQFSLHAPQLFQVARGIEQSAKGGDILLLGECDLDGVVSKLGIIEG